MASIFRRGLYCFRGPYSFSLRWLDKRYYCQNFAIVSGNT